MRLKREKVLSLLFACALAFLAAGIARAQVAAKPKRIARVPATVRGFIGGEAHDAYVVRGRRGQVLSVRIGWRSEKDNRAEFTVSRSASFTAPVAFGRAAAKGTRWTGRLPRTGDYYVYVVAHPSARYTLHVSLRQ